MAGFSFRLAEPQSPDRVRNIHVRTLAYLGDSVYELAMRLIHLNSHSDDTGRLHNSIVKYVQAASQAAVFDRIYPTLCESEQNMLKCWRNAKLPYRHSGTSPRDSARSTAFEAWIGFLFLTGRTERLNETINIALDCIDELYTDKDRINPGNDEF